MQILLLTRLTNMLLLANLGIIASKDDASRSPKLYGERDV